MPRSLCPLCLLGLASLLAAAPAAPAGPVSWSYNWSTSVGSFSADSRGADSIGLSTVPPGTLTGSASLNALNFATITPDLATERFTNRSYTLTLSVTDNTSHKSGSLSFQGTLGGVLAPSNNGVSLGFAHTSGVLALGGDRFDVTLNSPTPPGLGIVSAQVNVEHGGSPAPPPGPRPSPSPTPGPGPRPSPPPGPHDSPEPSTLLLAGLGLSALGGRAWWRRRPGAATA